MVERTAVISNRMGIHCRPSAVIFKRITAYEGAVRVARAGRSPTEIRTILSILSLGLNHGDRIRVGVSGPREEAFCDELASLFETSFDFPPRAQGELVPPECCD